MDKDITKYFQIKDKNKKISSIGNDDLIVKLDVENWEFKVMNHPQESLDGIQIYYNPQGVYCIESSLVGRDYIINEINENLAKKYIDDAKKEFALWGEYMSSSENICSEKLNGPNLERI